MVPPSPQSNSACERAYVCILRVSLYLLEEAHCAQGFCSHIAHAIALWPCAGTFIHEHLLELLCYRFIVHPRQQYRRQSAWRLPQGRKLVLRSSQRCAFSHFFDLRDIAANIVNTATILIIIVATLH